MVSLNGITFNPLSTVECIDNTYHEGHLTVGKEYDVVYRCIIDDFEHTCIIDDLGELRQYRSNRFKENRK